MIYTACWGRPTAEKERREREALGKVERPLARLQEMGNDDGDDLLSGARWCTIIRLTDARAHELLSKASHGGGVSPGRCTSLHEQVYATVPDTDRHRLGPAKCNSSEQASQRAIVSIEVQSRLQQRQQ